MSVPFYVNVGNQISSAVFSTIVAAGCGAAVGSISGRIYENVSKPLVFALHFASANLFWKYVVPYTFDQVFQHPSSNPAAQKMGFIIASAAGVASCCVFQGLLIPIIWDGIDDREKK